MDVMNFSLYRYPVINEKNMLDCIILFCPVYSIYIEKKFFMTIWEKEEEEKDENSIDKNFNEIMN